MICDRYTKKAKIGIILFISILLPLFYKDKISQNDLLLIIGLFYTFVVGFIGVAFVLPYIKCIIDYNQQHKPPYK